MQKWILALTEKELMLRGDDKYKRPIGILFDAGEGRGIAGQLKLKRGDLLNSNVLSIAHDQFVHVPDGGSLHGASEAGKVSVLDCIRGGLLGSTSWDDFTMHHGDVSFRYALFGKRHLGIDENCVRGIHFTLEGAESSVFARDKPKKFGYLRDPDAAVLDAIERTRPEHLKNDFVKRGAMVSYFTGDWDVLPRFETVLGTVYVGMSMRVDLYGRILEDTPRITVDFRDNPTTLEGALGKMREIRQFFSWMMGYAPGWKDVRVSTSRLDEDGYQSSTDGSLEVFGPIEWRELPEGAKRRGTLIDASHDPDHFMEVMGKWLERNNDLNRRSANARFFGCLPGISNRVIEDGIVSAANTFDLLPNEDKPKAEPLSQDMLKILADARDKTKSCTAPETQKNDILQTLGLIRRNRQLRHIVEHRAKIVLDHFGENRLKQLDRIIGLAVKCRNYYTHGPGELGPGDVDYTASDVVLFLTETLEFIYGASELLLCGWEPARSAGDDWHPLGGYINSYDARCKMVLGQKRQ